MSGPGNTTSVFSRHQPTYPGVGESSRAKRLHYSICKPNLPNFTALALGEASLKNKSIIFTRGRRVTIDDKLHANICSHTRHLLFLALFLHLLNLLVLREHEELDIAVRDTENSAICHEKWIAISIFNYSCESFDICNQVLESSVTLACRVSNLVSDPQLTLRNCLASYQGHQQAHQQGESFAQKNKAAQLFIHEVKEGGNLASLVNMSWNSCGYHNPH